MTALLAELADLGKALAVAGRLEESGRLLWTVMRRAEPDLPADRLAETVEWYGRVSRLLGRYARSRAVLLEGIALLEHEAAGLTLELGATALSSGGVDPGLGLRLAVAGRHEDPVVRAQSLALQGIVRKAHDGTEALGPVRIAAALLDACADDDLAGRLEALYWLAEAERLHGRVDRSSGHFVRLLAVAELTGQHFLRPLASVGLGRVRLSEGDVEDAARCAGEAEEQAERCASRPMRAAALTLSSQVSLARGEAAEAAESARRALGLAAPFPDIWTRRARRALALAGEALGGGPSRLVPTRRAAPTAPGPPRTGGVLNTLSRREMQIADLVGEGRTNQQIATALDLSPKTVETYLARIFKKLGIGSRTQIALLVGRAGAPVTLAP